MCVERNPRPVVGGGGFEPPTLTYKVNDNPVQSPGLPVKMRKAYVRSFAAKLSPKVAAHITAPHVYYTAVLLFCQRIIPIF